MKTLIVGGFVVPIYAALSLQQQFLKRGGSGRTRMEDGRLEAQFSWEKLAYEVSGTGTVPPGLDGLNDHTEYEVSCAIYKELAVAGTSVILPAARRTDSGYVPYVMACRPAAAPLDQIIEISASLAGDLLSWSALSGANHYIVRYYPKFTALIEFARSDESEGFGSRWTLTAEEV